MLLLVPLYFSYRKAQQHINIACGDPTGSSDSELTGANWAWMVLGGAYCVMAVIGLFLPEVNAQTVGKACGNSRPVWSYCRTLQR